MTPQVGKQQRAVSRGVVARPGCLACKHEWPRNQDRTAKQLLPATAARCILLPALPPAPAYQGTEVAALQEAPLLPAWDCLPLPLWAHIVCNALAAAAQDGYRAVLRQAAVLLAVSQHVSMACRLPCRCPFGRMLPNSAMKEGPPRRTKCSIAAPPGRLACRLAGCTHLLATNPCAGACRLQPRPRRCRCASTSPAPPRPT